MTRAISAGDLGPLAWRPIGPANMGGRVAAIALVPGSRTDFYVGFATGGLFKTTNLGTTFQEVFRHEATSSIGAIGVANAPDDWPGWDDLAAAGDTVAPEDRAEKGAGRIVWVGTGEGNGRNSVVLGQRRLPQHRRRRQLHPRRPGRDPQHPAAGRRPADPGNLLTWPPWAISGARTRSGASSRPPTAAQTWDHVLKVDDEVGACDVVLDPEQPGHGLRRPLRGAPDALELRRLHATRAASTAPTTAAPPGRG